MPKWIVNDPLRFHKEIMKEQSEFDRNFYRFLTTEPVRKVLLERLNYDYTEELMPPNLFMEELKSVFIHVGGNKEIFIDFLKNDLALRRDYSGEKTSIIPRVRELYINKKLRQREESKKKSETVSKGVLFETCFKSVNKELLEAPFKALGVTEESSIFLEKNIEDLALKLKDNPSLFKFIVSNCIRRRVNRLGKKEFYIPE